MGLGWDLHTHAEHSKHGIGTASHNCTDKLRPNMPAKHAQQTCRSCWSYAAECRRARCSGCSIQSPIAAGTLTLCRNALRSQLSELCCPSPSLELVASQWLRPLCLVGIELCMRQQQQRRRRRKKFQQRHKQQTPIVTD
jgi:hypothetical protein